MYSAYNIHMKDVNWDNKKNSWFKENRGISFEIIKYHIENQESVDIVKHPNKERYPNQWMFIIEIHDYIYCVPFVENEEEVFLKTIFPSRALTKKYLKKKEVSP